MSIARGTLPGFWEVRDETGLAEMWWLPPTCSPVKIAGRGSFGAACLVECEGMVELCIVKRVPMLVPPKEVRGPVRHWADKALRRTLRELGILRRLQPLSHNAIVRLLGAWTDHRKLRHMRLQGAARERRPIPALYLLFERLLPSPCLHGPMGRGGTGSSEGGISDVTQILFGVLRGVACLHANGLLHGDLKPTNVLFTAAGEPRLIDFGMAREAPRPLDPDAEEEDLGEALGSLGAILQCGGEGERRHGGAGRRRRHSIDTVTRWYRPPELVLAELLQREGFAQVGQAYNGMRCECLMSDVGRGGRRRRGRGGVMVVRRVGLGAA